MAGSGDYGATIGGGLKLKGSKPSGITKKKKSKDPSKSKSNKSNVQDDNPSTTALQTALADEEHHAGKTGDGDIDVIEGEPEEDEGGQGSSKTEAERKYEEMRRKRLDERLKKEGVKTHKQRVEELNKYLSTLSEHHDMPRIGPG